MGKNNLLVHNICSEAEIEKRLSTVEWNREVWPSKNYTKVVYTEGKNEFINKYKPDHWKMQRNFKHQANYYMSDVIYSQAKNVFGDNIPMPNIITRKSIVNNNTLRILDRYKAASPDKQLSAFMTQTVNGKSTQRILDMFGWKAYRISFKPEEILPSVDVYLTS